MMLVSGGLWWVMPYFRTVPLIILMAIIKYELAIAISKAYALILLSFI